jgi:hypothetical protein
MNKIKLTALAAALFCGLLTARAQNGIFPDVQALAEDVVNSPWGASAGFGRSTTGNKDVAYVLITDQLVTNIGGTAFSSGPIVGYDELFAPHVKQVNSLSGGWQLSLTQHPFAFIGKTFVTNFVTSELAYTLVATPRLSTSPIGSITGTALTLDPYPHGLWNFHIKALGAYEDRTGQGLFNGNYWIFGGVISHDF